MKPAFPSASPIALAQNTPDTPTATMADTFASQLPVALAWRSASANVRKQRIARLRSALLARREALYAAFAADLRKGPSEVEATELLPVLDEMRHALGQLRRWMKPHRVWPTATLLGTSSAIHYQPRGRVLIVAPWNYPLNLCLGPLVSALAAGNTAIVKPSEMTPAVSALIGQILAEVFPPSEVALFEGGPPTTQALLDLPFDHIFFTGSPAVGKLVMVAAARHLTSVTLELGGKSPSIVDETADLRRSAETLMWGKFLNNGQTCVAPDHVYVHASVQQAFADECVQALQRMYGRSASDRQSSPDLTRVVNARHTQRLTALLADATARGARLLTGGEVDAVRCYVAPTLLTDVPEGARILDEEIFGPLLPICSYTQLDAVIAQINTQPKPLALYVFSRNNAHIHQILQQTSSGGACVNHCVMQYAHGNLPFGGVNNSGMGSAHGFYGFKAFSHERAVLRGRWPHLVKLFFPPFTPGRSKLVRAVVDTLRLPML